MPHFVDLRVIVGELMSRSLLLMGFFLTLVTSTQPAHAEFNTIKMSQAEGIAQLCGKLYQMARATGANPTSVETRMLIMFDNQGATESQLQILKIEFGMGQVGALQNGWRDEAIYKIDKQEAEDMRDDIYKTLIKGCNYPTSLYQPD